MQNNTTDCKSRKVRKEVIKMSVTMSLYTIAKDISFIHGRYCDYAEIPESIYELSATLYSQVREKADEKFGVADMSDEKTKWIDDEFDKVDPLYFGHFSDNKDHDVIEIEGSNYEKDFETYFGDYIQHGYGQNDNTKYLIVTELNYRQGWFFKKKFMNSTNTIRNAFTKKTAIQLLNDTINRTEYYGREAYNSFLNNINSLEDGTFILHIAW